MDFEEQKNLAISKIKGEKSLSDDFKKSFEDQIRRMNEREFSFFLESLGDASRDKNIGGTLESLKQTEKNLHEQIMEMAGSLSKKITRNQSEEDDIESKKKTDSLLDKTKSL